MGIWKFTTDQRTRFNKNTIQPFLEGAPSLRRLLLRERARGEQCWLDKDSGLLGPGIRFKDGSFLMLPSESGSRMSQMYRRRTPKPRKPSFPKLLMWQDKFLKLLKVRPRRATKASGLLRKRKAVR